MAWYSRACSMDEPKISALLVRAGGHTCALSLSHVIEVMRALPVETLAGAPEMVRGLTVIRGQPVPVVSLGGLFSANCAPPSRMVVVSAGGRWVALGVDKIIGIQAFAGSRYEEMPALLKEANKGAIEKIALLDSELLFVLQTAGIVPREFLETMPAQEQ